MIVVADTGPLHYLVLIHAVDVLHPLYGRVLIPEAVVGELQADGAPAMVRAWISQPPDWLEIQPDPPFDGSLALLDSGEAAAIALALSAGADRLLIDDWDGRAEAVRRRLLVTGTLGVLVAAHRAGLLNFEVAFDRLGQTNFYLSEELIARVRRRLLD